MTIFELSIILVGLMAAIAVSYAVQMLCKTLIHLGEMITQSLTQLHITLMKCLDNLDFILESLQNIDEH